MVFGSVLDQETMRASTWEEAVNCHSIMQKRVEKVLKESAEKRQKEILKFNSENRTIRID